MTRSESLPAPVEFLTDLFHCALGAVDPLRILAAHLPPRPKGRTIVVGAGKASARMALALEQCWDGPLEGQVVTRYGHGEACRRIGVMEAGHPIPDGAGVEAARRMIASVQGLTAHDLVIALMSGGGSALLAAPAPGIELSDKRSMTEALLACGASIGEINVVRRRLSAVKAGRLAQACGAASVHTLVVSDVPGDDPSVVASGPTIPDHDEPSAAEEVLRRYGIDPPPHVLAALRRTPDALARNAEGPRRSTVIATAQNALDAAAERARSLGVRPIVLGDSIEGEARHVGTVIAAIARQIARRAQPIRAPAVVLSGGETSVTVRGGGQGGRNVEFLLSQAIALDRQPSTWSLAADTDGIDGSQDNAGAVIGPDTLERAARAGLNARDCLQRNDAYSFFHALGDLVTTGPTRTNVNDFRATLVL